MEPGQANTYIRYGAELISFYLLVWNGEVGLTIWEWRLRVMSRFHFVHYFWEYGSSYLKDCFERDSEAIVRHCRKVCRDQLMGTALEVWVEEEKMEAPFFFFQHPLQVETKIAINYILRKEEQGPHKYRVRLLCYTAMCLKVKLWNFSIGWVRKVIYVQ